MLHRCLAQQIIIQPNYPVAKGEAFGLDSVTNLTHVRLCKMDDGREGVFDGRGMMEDVISFCPIN